jgi:hypothetical protein
VGLGTSTAPPSTPVGLGTSTAKLVRMGALCDLRLCLSPGTPSMSSDDSVTTIAGGDKDESLLLDLFV